MVYLHFMLGLLFSSHFLKIFWWLKNFIWQVEFRASCSPACIRTSRCFPELSITYVFALHGSWTLSKRQKKRKDPLLRNLWELWSQCVAFIGLVNISCHYRILCVVMLPCGRYSNKNLSFGIVDLGLFPNAAEKFGIYLGGKK